MNNYNGMQRNIAGNIVFIYLTLFASNEKRPLLDYIRLYYSTIIINVLREMKNIQYEIFFIYFMFELYNVYTVSGHIELYNIL